MKPVERRIHDLTTRDEVEHGTRTRKRDEDEKTERDDLLGAVEGSLSPPLPPTGRNESCEERIVEARERRNDREPIEKREIPTEDQRELETHHQDAGDMAGAMSSHT